jgi:hypothetical protein
MREGLELEGLRSRTYFAICSGLGPRCGTRCLLPCSEPGLGVSRLQIRVWGVELRVWCTFCVGIVCVVFTYACIHVNVRAQCTGEGTNL